MTTVVTWVKNKTTKNRTDHRTVSTPTKFISICLLRVTSMSETACEKAWRGAVFRYHIPAWLLLVWETP